MENSWSGIQNYLRASIYPGHFTEKRDLNIGYEFAKRDLDVPSSL